MYTDTNYNCTGNGQYTKEQNSASFLRQNMYLIYIIIYIIYF